MTDVDIYCYYTVGGGGLQGVWRFFVVQSGENKKVLDKSTTASYNDTGIF
jgi:hypothetical protein